MSTLGDTIALFAPGFRSRAYCQAMANSGLTPARALLLPGREPEWSGETGFRWGEAVPFEFEPALPVAESLRSARVPFDVLASDDVHNARVLDLLAEHRGSVVVYSGKGGVLLRKPAFETGVRFLHAHGGLVPSYRGSTAFYYSLLDRGDMAATAIWLDLGIDTGAVIDSICLPPPQGLDIDYVADPMLRAAVLLKVLRCRVDRGCYPEGSRQSRSEERTYHVIHPVLKHIALRRCGLAQ